MTGIRRRRSRVTGLAGVAEKMADAVTYLSRVADDAGLDGISADLLSIRRRLHVEARRAGGERVLSSRAPRSAAQKLRN